MNRIDLVTRRTFLGGVFTAGAFVLSARILPLDALASSGTGAAGASNAAWNPSVYLGIETDGTVIIEARFVPVLRTHFGRHCHTDGELGCRHDPGHCSSCCSGHGSGRVLDRPGRRASAGAAFAGVGIGNDQTGCANIQRWPSRSSTRYCC